MAENLIMKCKDIVSNHVDSLKEKKESYNIYRLLNVTNKEVQMCRVLADLLDPYGTHGEGAKYLIEFFKEVIKRDVSEGVLQKANVYTEYPITNDRRIDIVISYFGGFIPIEVKIYADDQKSQCYDYYNFARKMDRDACIYYLTRKGVAPSECSVTDDNGNRLDDKVIRCISFESSVLSWLNRIKGIAKKNMVPFIDQYEGAVRDFVDNNEEEYKMKLSETINNSEYLKTALEIARTIDYTKAELMKKVFNEFKIQLEPKLKELDLEEETKAKWLHYDSQATEKYYATKESTRPGLNYVIHSVNLGNELSLWLRIEIDYRIFACLCVYDYGDNSNNEQIIGAQCERLSDLTWNNLCKYIKLPEKKEKMDGLLRGGIYRQERKMHVIKLTRFPILKR